MIKQRLLVSAFALVLPMTLLSVPASAQLFGPSDEEKAHEASQDQQLSDLANQARQQSDQNLRGRRAGLFGIAFLHLLSKVRDRRVQVVTQ